MSTSEHERVSGHVRGHESEHGSDRDSDRGSEHSTESERERESASESESEREQTAASASEGAFALAVRALDVAMRRAMHGGFGVQFARDADLLACWREGQPHGGSGIRQPSARPFGRLLVAIAITPRDARADASAESGDSGERRHCTMLISESLFARARVDDVEMLDATSAAIATLLACARHATGGCALALMRGDEIDVLDALRATSARMLDLDAVQRVLCAADVRSADARDADDLASARLDDATERITGQIKAISLSETRASALDAHLAGRGAVARALLAFGASLTWLIAAPIWMLGTLVDALRGCIRALIRAYAERRAARRRRRVITERRHVPRRHAS